jgi:hypothetical protein
LNEDDVIMLLRLLLENIFIQNGDILRRQRVGLPMGTNCAPPLANLYFYYYESRFIDRLVDRKLFEQAQAFHMLFRFIDDTLSIDNPYWMNAATQPPPFGIYPPELRLNSTSISLRHVNFIGMSIKSDSTNTLVFDVHDKRSDFPFAVRRYPHALSSIPMHIPAAVFLGQLHRYYSICSTCEAFVRNSVLLAKTLIAQGMTHRQCVPLLKRFLCSRPSIRYKSTGHNVRSIVDAFNKGSGN